MLRNQSIFTPLVLLLGMALLDCVAAASAGCGKAPALTSGIKTMTINGKTRQYILKVPDNYDKSHPYRLIFGFHWYGGTMTDVATGQTVQRDVWSYYGLQRLANNTAIFVAPQGLDSGWANSNGDDVTFVDNMIKTIEAGLCVDEKLRFAAGFSYGGAMCKTLACQRAKAFRAVAVYDGGGPNAISCGSDPIAFLGVHGISDGIDRGRQTRDIFVKNNGCTPQSNSDPAPGSHKHVKTVYSGCKAGYPVWWLTFDGGHIAAPYDGGSGDNGSKAFSPPETWQFFSQFG